MAPVAACEREQVMLRITQIQSAPDEVRLILEGRLLGPWVEELQAAVMTARSSAGSMCLDLSGVHFVDAEGLTLVRRLLEQGVGLRDASPFVQELLKSRQQ